MSDFIENAIPPMPTIESLSAANQTPDTMAAPNDAEIENPKSRVENQFTAVAALYDELMQGVPYEQWIVYLRKLLEERKAKPQTVLDLACGTGNVTELLAREGFAMTGADIAPHMIAEARRKAASKGLAIDYYVQDAAELDLPVKNFDLCVSLFDSLNYVTDPARLQMALGRVAAHLVSGGLFIFDLNSEYALVNHFFDQDNIGTPEPLRYKWTSEYLPDSRLCRVDMRFWYRDTDEAEQAFEETHWQFAYREDEIVAMLRQAGFDTIKTYKAYTLRAPVKSSDRIFYVARRP